MKKKLLIFTEGGKGMGYGHLSRCSALYEGACSIDMEPLIVANESAKNINIIENKNTIFADWQQMANIKKIDIKNCYCAVDSYLADKNIYEYISKNCLNALYFDDENRIEYPKGFILNMGLKSGYPYSETKLLGINFALVRDAFIKNKKVKFQDKISDLLIFLGADLNNYSESLVREIIKAIPEITIHLVKTSINKGIMPLADKVKVYRDLNAVGFAELIKHCDAGIITASQTAVEFCAVGTPYVCIRTASNQSFDWMLKNKIIEHGIDCQKNILTGDILIALRELSSKAKREGLTGIMQKTIDGLGAQRILRAVING